MNQIRLGQTDVTASSVGMGTWAIGGDSCWGANNDEESIAAIQKARECGITLIDTAPAYGLGHSEEVVGRAIHDARDSYVLASKCGLVWDEEEGAVLTQRDGVTLRRVLSAASLRRQLEQSLRRLQTDHLDLYITHWQTLPPFQTPIEETMQTLNAFVKEGKIRAIGVSNVTPEQIREYAKYGTIAVVQQKYSLLDRTCEQNGILDVCRELRISFQAYSPLERGMLSGKVRMDTTYTGTAKNGIRWYAPEQRARVIAMLEQFRPLCEKYDISMASLVIAWTAARAENFSVLCGARKTAQVADNAAGGSVALSEQDAAYMDRLARELLRETENAERA